MQSLLFDSSHSKNPENLSRNDKKHKEFWFLPILQLLQKFHHTWFDYSFLPKND
jgi:hypothetical protein